MLVRQWIGTRLQNNRSYSGVGLKKVMKFSCQDCIKYTKKGSSFLTAGQPLLFLKYKILFRGPLDDVLAGEGDGREGGDVVGGAGENRADDLARCPLFWGDDFAEGH